MYNLGGVKAWGQHPQYKFVMALDQHLSSLALEIHKSSLYCIEPAGKLNFLNDVNPWKRSAQIFIPDISFNFHISV